MIRMLAIAVTAVMAVSATAATAGEIIVKVRGRATPVVHAEIVSAARQLCKEDLAGNPKASDLTPFCIREVTRDAVVRTKSEELRAYDKTQGRASYLRLATR
jgi:predicted transglutaminase-like cysteine proteinase